MQKRLLGLPSSLVEIEVVMVGDLLEEWKPFPNAVVAWGK
jgi:hypothetical protein